VTGRYFEDCNEAVVIAERADGMSELASESVSQRLREAPTERSEGVR